MKLWSVKILAELCEEQKYHNILAKAGLLSSIIKIFLKHSSSNTLTPTLKIIAYFAYDGKL